MGWRWSWGDDTTTSRNLLFAFCPELSYELWHETVDYSRLTARHQLRGSPRPIYALV
jgi:hypothetical protein